jgi:flagellar capping protein FliD
MSFDESKLNALTTDQLSGAFALFGSATTGLGALEKAFTQLSDAATGSIQTQINGFDAADRRITAQVAEMTERVNNMQLAMSRRLQMADSLLASLASQKSLLTSSIDSLNFATYGYINKG